MRLRADWDAVRLDIMLLVLREKFRQSDVARQALLATGTAALVENSPRDAFWGSGRAIGVGQNHLGRLLMLVRNELRQQGKSAASEGNMCLQEKATTLKRKRSAETTTVITIKL